MDSRPASGRCAARASSPKRSRRAVRGWQGCGRPARVPTQSIQSTSRRAAYLILSAFPGSSGLSVVVCWRWCATVYVLENSLLQQPTPNSAGPVFSWTRRWLPAISATVMVRFTVHHRRTLL